MKPQKIRTARLDIRMKPEDKAYLAEMAEEEGRTLTSMVQGWLDEAIRKDKEGAK